MRRFPPPGSTTFATAARHSGTAASYYVTFRATFHLTAFTLTAGLLHDIIRIFQFFVTSFGNFFEISIRKCPVEARLSAFRALNLVGFADAK